MPPAVQPTGQRARRLTATCRPHGVGSGELSSVLLHAPALRRRRTPVDSVLTPIGRHHCRGVRRRSLSYRLRARLLSVRHSLGLRPIRVTHGRPGGVPTGFDLLHGCLVGPAKSGGRGAARWFAGQAAGEGFSARPCPCNEGHPAGYSGALRGRRNGLGSWPERSTQSAASRQVGLMSNRQIVDGVPLAAKSGGVVLPTASAAFGIKKPAVAGSSPKG